MLILQHLTKISRAALMGDSYERRFFYNTDVMNVILQCGVLLTFLSLGELAVWLTDVPVPSSIIGMLLLAAALQLRVVRLRHVEQTANFLVRNLGFFFVPAGVGLMSCLDLLAAELLPIVGTMVVSTAVILVVTGHTHQLVRRHMHLPGGHRHRRRRHGRGTPGATPGPSRNVSPENRNRS